MLINFSHAGRPLLKEDLHSRPVNKTVLGIYLLVSIIVATELFAVALIFFSKDVLVPLYRLSLVAIVVFFIYFAMRSPTRIKI